MTSFITPKEAELAKTDPLHIPTVLRVGTKKNDKWRAEMKKSQQKRIEAFHKKITILNTKTEIKPILDMPTEDTNDPPIEEVKRPLGPPPKPKRSKEIDKYGFKVETKVSQAAALYARKEGASLNEIKEIVGSPQRNLLKTVDKLPEFEVIKKTKKGMNGKETVRYYIKELKTKKPR